MSTGLRMAWDENSITRVKRAFQTIMSDFNKTGELNIRLADKEVFQSINKEIDKIQQKLNLGEIKVDGTKIREALSETVKDVNTVKKELSSFGEVTIKNKVFDKDGLQSFIAELRTADGLVQKIKYGASGYTSGTKGALIPSEYKMGSIVENDNSRKLAASKIEELKRLEQELTGVMESESQKRERTVNEESKTRSSLINEELKNIANLQTALDNLKMKNKNNIQGDESVKFNALQQKITGLSPKDSSGIKSATSDLIKYEQHLKEVQRVSKLGEKIFDLPKNKNIPTNTAELKQYINQFYDGKAKIKSFSDAFDANGQKIKKFTIELNEGNNQIRKEKLILDESTNALYRNSSAVGENTSKRMSMADRFKEAFRGFASFAGVMGVIYGTIRQVKEGISIVSDLDKSQTNIRMITGMNRETVQGLTQDYSGLATELKTTTREIMGGAEEFLRAGHNIDETRTLLKTSTIGAAVSGQENNAMAEQLIAISNGFQMATSDGEQMMHVIDTLSTLDNNSATSMKEISEAMQHTASSAKNAGVDFDQLSTYIATVSSVSRKSASSIGESFKTIFSRYSGVKLNKVLKDDTQTLSDVEASMGRIGINIRSSKDEFKDFNIVLDELKPKWATMTDIDKSTVASALAGTRQKENFLILMDNMEQTDSLMKKVGDSAGSAEKKFDDAFKDSLKASVSEFKNEVEKLWMTLIKSDGLKSIVNLGTSFVKTLHALTQISTESKKQILLLGGAILVVGGILRNLITLSFQTGTAVSALSLITKMFTGVTTTAATATTGLTAALQFLFMTPAGLVLTGIALALGVAGVAIYKNIKAQKDLQLAIDKTNESYVKFNKSLNEFNLDEANNELKSFEDKQIKINELIEKRAELEEKVQKAKDHKGIPTSKEDREEFNEFRQKKGLDKVNKELNDLMDGIEAEGGTVDRTTGKYSEYLNMKSRLNGAETAQGIENDRKEMERQNDSLTSLIEKHKEYSSMGSKTPIQQTENNRIIDELTAKYSDLNVVIDENGTKQIENTSLLDEKTNSLKDEKDTVLSSIDAYANWIESANTYQVRQQEIELIQSQIQEYLELMGVQGRSAEENARMSDLAAILAGRYSDLTLQIDENGNAQIYNTDLLGIKNGALDTERQAIFNNIGAYEEWSSKTIWLQGETTKVTLAEARARFSILSAERNALIAVSGGSSYAGGFGMSPELQDLSNMLGDYDISLIKLKDKLNSGGGGGYKSPRYSGGSSGGYKPTTPVKSGGRSSKGGSGERHKTEKQDIQDLDLKIDRYATLKERLDQVGYSLDRNKQKQDEANNPDKIKLLREEISLLKQKQVAINDIWEEKERERVELERELRNGGFGIADGVILNYKQELQVWQDWVNASTGDTKKQRNDQTKDIEEKAKRYLSIMGEIRSTNKDWYEIDNLIRKVKSEQLKMLEDAEKTITDMLKSQVEERKKAIDDEYNKRKKAMEDEYNKRVEWLNKTKELYNEKNSDDDFEKSLTKEKQVMQELKASLAAAGRDLSNEGKFRMEQLRKEIEAQQLKIEEMVTNKQREKNNQAIDEQIKALEQEKKLKEEALEEENKLKRETLEKEWSDDRIAKIVSQALSNGFFKDVNGEFVDLKESYVKWMNEFNNGTSIAGQRIKDEFITNLQQVKSIMSEIKSLSGDLGFNYTTPEIINRPSVASSESLSKVNTPSLFSLENLTKSMGGNNTFKVESLINIEHADDNIADKLDTIVDMALEKFTRKMTDLNWQMG